MSRFIVLRYSLRYYRSDIETQISSLLIRNNFHYSCAALRVAIDIEMPIVFLYSLSFTISLSQRSTAIVEILFNTGHKKFALRQFRQYAAHPSYRYFCPPVPLHFQNWRGTCPSWLYGSGAYDCDMKFHTSVIYTYIHKTLSGLRLS